MVYRPLIAGDASRPVPTTLAPVASARAPFLWLCGPTGVGKSSVGYAIFQQVYSSGVKVAYVDFDQLACAIRVRRRSAQSSREGAEPWRRLARLPGSRRRCLIAASGCRPAK